MYNLVGLDKCIHPHDPHPCCWMSKGTKSAHQTEKSFFFGCTESSLLPVGSVVVVNRRCFCCSAHASHCSGFPYCRLSSASERAGFSSYGAWVAPRHVESSRTRDCAHVPCIGRWVLIHCTMRDVPEKHLEMTNQGGQLHPYNQWISLL